MLKLKKISDLLKDSADSLELQGKTATEILTSQEYQNSKIKF
jgi:hypothetical protein